MARKKIYITQLASLLKMLEKLVKNNSMKTKYVSFLAQSV